MNHLFKHKIVKVPHPDTKALIPISVSNGQHHNPKRGTLRKALNKLTRRERQLAVKELKSRGIKYHG